MDSQIKTASVWNDFYDLKCLNHQAFEDFKSEKEMCSYIDFYAKEFAEDVLCIEYQSQKGLKFVVGISVP